MNLLVISKFTYKIENYQKSAMSDCSIFVIDYHVRIQDFVKGEV